MAETLDIVDTADGRVVASYPADAYLVVFGPRGLQTSKLYQYLNVPPRQVGVDAKVERRQERRQIQAALVVHPSTGQEERRSGVGYPTPEDGPCADGLMSLDEWAEANLRMVVDDSGGRWARRATAHRCRQEAWSVFFAFLLHAVITDDLRTRGAFDRHELATWEEWERFNTTMRAWEASARCLEEHLDVIVVQLLVHRLVRLLAVELVAAYAPPPELRPVLLGDTGRIVAHAGGTHGPPPLGARALAVAA